MKSTILKPVDPNDADHTAHSAALPQPGDRFFISYEQTLELIQSITGAVKAGVAGNLEYKEQLIRDAEQRISSRRSIRQEPDGLV
jgi:hypothetical protein